MTIRTPTSQPGLDLARLTAATEARLRHTGSRAFALGQAVLALMAAMLTPERRAKLAGDAKQAGRLAASGALWVAAHWPAAGPLAPTRVTRPDPPTDLLAALRRLDGTATAALDRWLTIEHLRRLQRGLGAAVTALVVVAVAGLATLAPGGGPAPAVASGLVPGQASAAEAEVPLTGPAAPLAARTSPPAVVAADPPVAPRRPVPPAIPALRGALPVGKGMWLWQPAHVEGGNPDAIVSRAHQLGLTHLYVRLGSSVDGFNETAFLDRILPVAHAGGIRIYGWDFPYLDNADGDVDRAVTEIRHTSPGGHRIDGFAADIELKSMGVNINPTTAFIFTTHLRQRVGAAFPLIAVVPRPSSELIDYPFNEVVGAFDAIAPMVYWLNREPAGDVAGALDLFHRAYPGKPVMPIGQAYDGAPEGGRPGVPPRGELLRFAEVAEQHGALGVSFWSWQHADGQALDAVRDMKQFELPSTSNPAQLRPGQVVQYQALLTSLGFPVPRTGHWDQATTAAVAAYQRAANVPVTGVIDATTHTLLMAPFTIPLL